MGCQKFYAHLKGMVKNLETSGDALTQRGLEAMAVDAMVSLYSCTPGPFHKLYTHVFSPLKLWVQANPGRRLYVCLDKPSAVPVQKKPEQAMRDAANKAEPYTAVEGLTFESLVENDQNIDFRRLLITRAWRAQVMYKLVDLFDKDKVGWPRESLVVFDGIDHANEAPAKGSYDSIQAMAFGEGEVGALKWLMWDVEKFGSKGLALRSGDSDALVLAMYHLYPLRDRVPTILWDYRPGTTFVDLKTLWHWMAGEDKDRTAMLHLSILCGTDYFKPGPVLHWVGARYIFAKYKNEVSRKFFLSCIREAFRKSSNKNEVAVDQAQEKWPLLLKPKLVKGKTVMSRFKIPSKAVANAALQDFAFQAKYWTTLDTPTASAAE